MDADIFVLSFALILAVPIGYWIAWLARDELVKGRKWFKVLMIWFLVLGVLLSVYGRIAEALSYFVVAIFAVIAYRKSFDKKWVVPWGRA